MPNAIQLYDPKTGERVNVACLVGPQGPAGPQGPKGDPGSGGGIDVSGASIGQTVKISAVDDNGTPTAWEPVDFPSGSGEDLWEHILTYTEETGPELYEHIFSEWPDGTPFNFKSLVVKVVAAAGTKNEYITFNANRKSLNLGYVTGVTTASGVTSVLILDTVPVKLASGEILRTADARIGAWNTATASSQYVRRCYGVPMYRLFDSVYEINVSGALPIGSTIEIYGVRA